MIVARPWPRLLRELGVANCRTTRELQHMHASIPAGTIGTVTGTSRWSSLVFKAAPCAHCGIRFRIHGLSQRDLELIDSVPD